MYLVNDANMCQDIKLASKTDDDSGNSVLDDLCYSKSFVADGPYSVIP
jgi:hypothetical protein